MSFQEATAPDGSVSDEILAGTFNFGAQNYDRFRPNYPGSIYEVVTKAVPPLDQTKVLEIGCGTGQASVALAQLGYNIVAIEPGAELAAIAKRNLEKYPNAQVINSSFEEAELSPKSFDLVLAAMSLHWVQEDQRFSKPHALLKHNGFLAILYNWPVLTDEAKPFYESVSQVASTHNLPEAALMPSPQEMIDIRPAIDTKLFEDSKFYLQPMHYKYKDPLFFVGYLATLSNVAALPEALRHGFLSDLSKIIEDKYSEGLELPFVSTAAISQKRAD